MAATLNTTLRFIEGASESDIDALAEAMRARSSVLREQWEQSIRVGATVVLRELTPESLNGLTGVVKSLITARGQRRVSVLLDVDSTKNLRSQSNRFAATVSPKTKRHLFSGVPMKSCVEVES